MTVGLRDQAPSSGGRHNPRRRLELGHGQLGLAVGALLHGELLVQGRELHLAVGQEGLPHDGGQQGGHHHGNGHDGEEPSPTSSGAAPSNAAPRASRDDPERGAPGRRSFCATPRTAGCGAGCRTGGMPAGRCCRGSGRRRHQEAPPAGRARARPLPRAQSARWPAAGRSRSGDWRRSPPPTPCARPGRQADDARRHRRRTAGREGTRTRRWRRRRRLASSGGPRRSDS